MLSTLQFKKYLKKYIRLIRVLIFISLLFSSSDDSQANPWLSDSDDTVLSASVFISPEFELSEYKGYINYGLSEKINLGCSILYQKKHQSFLNEIFAQVKIYEKYSDNFQLILSGQTLNKSYVEDKNILEFLYNKLTFMAGLKTDVFFITFEPYIIINIDNYYLEFDLSAGLDYSEYTTLIFSKTFSSHYSKYKLNFIKNIVGNLDINIEYLHHVNCLSEKNVCNRLTLGLCYKF